MSSSIVIDRRFAGLVSSDPHRAVVERRASVSDPVEIESIKRDAFNDAKRRFDKDLLAEKEKQSVLWDSLATSFDKFLSSVETQVSDQLVGLSVKIAEMILHRELPDTSMLHEVIRDTLGPISDLQGCTIKLNPSQAEEMLKLHKGTGSQQIIDRVELVSDNSLDEGDVVIESRNGYFDGRISERLELLKERLLERYANSTSNDA